LRTLTTDRVSGMSFGLICLILVFLLVTIHIAGRRWQAEGRFRSHP
jgi:hypothetical protein